MLGKVADTRLVGLNTFHWFLFKSHRLWHACFPFAHFGGGWKLGRATRVSVMWQTCGNLHCAIRWNVMRLLAYLTISLKKPIWRRRVCNKYTVWSVDVNYFRSKTFVWSNQRLYRKRFETRTNTAEEGSYILRKVAPRTHTFAYTRTPVSVKQWLYKKPFLIKCIWQSLYRWNEGTADAWDRNSIYFPHDSLLVIAKNNVILNHLF